MQDQHGGFNPKMLEVLNLVGEVHRLTSNGDVRVQYPGDPATSYRWTVSYDTHNKIQLCVLFYVEIFLLVSLQGPCWDFIIAGAEYY